jgi:hypothetical protein
VRIEVQKVAETQTSVSNCVDLDQLLHLESFTNRGHINWSAYVGGHLHRLPSGHAVGITTESKISKLRVARLVEENIGRFDFKRAMEWIRSREQGGRTDGQRTEMRENRERKESGNEEGGGRREEEGGGGSRESRESRESRCSGD